MSKKQLAVGVSTMALALAGVLSQCPDDKPVAPVPSPPPAPATVAVSDAGAHR